MEMTATQKIIAKHAGLKRVKAGQLVMVNVDKVLINDITAPVSIQQFNKLEKPVFSKDNVIIVLDHFTPNKDIKSAEQCKISREFAKKHDITHFYDVGQAGIEHVLLPEQGLINTSEIIIGADSHTCTYGALSCFSTGVGSTDAAVCMATGKIWLKVPTAIKINISGCLKKYVTGKDVALTIIKKLGVDGATYKSLEFFGNIENLSIDDRFTICNMAVECGAKNAYFPCDNITKQYLTDKICDINPTIYPDNNCKYEKIIDIDLSNIVPVVALPHLPSNVINVSSLNKIYIDQVVIGSCTNGRLSDLKTAADLFKNHRVKNGVRCIIIPATMSIYLKALELGYIKTFIESGAVVSTPTCGCCLGGYMGILASNEKCVATTNRNFVGRMGHPQSEVYLASPYVAASSAILGYIATPSEVENETAR